QQPGTALVGGDLVEHGSSGSGQATARPRARPGGTDGAALEADLDGPARLGVADLEVRLGREPAPRQPGHEGGGERLPADVVVAHGVVVELPGVVDLVLG